MDSLRLTFLLIAINAISAVVIPDVDYDKAAQDELKESLKVKYNYNKAKNVILFLGDGMGLSTVTAARIYKGQQNGKPGEETVMAWERFPHVGLSKTYNHNHQVSDSAGTATAYMCGRKANFGTIGVNHKVPRGDCDAQNGNELDSIAKWSATEGKSVGVVTTTRLTHATPAAAYGHTAERYWEGDSKQTPAQRSRCPDLAQQLVTDNHHFQVFLGGGRKYFLPEDTPDPEYPEKNGTRLDGRDLFDEWKQYNINKGRKHAFVWNEEQFDAVDTKQTDYLLGAFEYDNMHYEGKRDKDIAGEPHLANMTRKAIEILSKNKQGFFLLVEGGRIDHAHHDSLAHLALIDTLAFEKAVETGLDMTSLEDTLIVVTADHSHVFTVGGYPSRGNDILGFVDEVAVEIEPALDKWPYLTLAYTNGPNAPMREAREDLTNMTEEELHDKDFAQPSMVPVEWETHGGEDVGIWALGPMAHLFHSTHEQNYIAHVMAYASCVGINKDHCSTRYPGQEKPQACSASSIQTGLYIINIILACLQLYH